MSESRESDSVVESVEYTIRMLSAEAPLAARPWLKTQLRYEAYINFKVENISNELITNGV